MQNKEMEFKTIVSKYCDMKPEDIKNDMRFREDLETIVLNVIGKNTNAYYTK